MAQVALAADRPLRELRGVVERITYQNPENGYTVAPLAPERPESEAEAARGDDRLVTVVGTLVDLTRGARLPSAGRRSRRLRRDGLGRLADRAETGAERTDRRHDAFA